MHTQTHSLRAGLDIRSSRRRQLGGSAVAGRIVPLEGKRRDCAARESDVGERGKEREREKVVGRFDGLLVDSLVDLTRLA